MFHRRDFLKISGLTSLSLLLEKSFAGTAGEKPLVISTWAPNVKANADAWKILGSGGSAIDAVEAGVQVPEADPTDMSVGYGGLPDRDGKVTLDACIMDHKGGCGSVAFLQGIRHPIKVARLVMEKTPHVMLAGEGALQFAIAQGFEYEELLTPEAEKAWKNWLKSSHYDPMTTPKMLEERRNIPGQIDNHDTIGMLAIDAAGNLSGACTTSGMAYKLHGRVGDSPIIGAGLYVDNEIGAATSTGVGEEVIRICGSHTVVEMMRQGYKPEAACRKAVERIIRIKGRESAKDVQVGFIALNKKGEYGGFAIQKGFTYAIHGSSGAKVLNARALV